MTQESSIKAALGKLQDTLGGLAGKINAKMTTDADSFVENVFIADLYERKAARVVLLGSVSPSVGEVALEMLADHTTSSHHLIAALEMNEARGVKAPSYRLDERRERMLEHLSEATPDKREGVYVEQQVLAHEEALALLTAYQSRGDNAQLRSFAAATAPVVARHLRRMKALAAS